MATKLHRELARTSESRLPNGRSVVIELSPPNLITLRESGRRKRVAITTEALYSLLVKREVDRLKEEKRKSRTKPKRAKR